MATYGDMSYQRMPNFGRSPVYRRSPYGTAAPGPEAMSGIVPASEVGGGPYAKLRQAAKNAEILRGQETPAANDPRGAYLNELRKALSEREGQDVAQAGLAASLYGGEDPMARLYGRLSAEQAARNRYALFLPQASAEYMRQAQLQDYDWRKAKYAASQQPKQNWWDPILDIGGQAIGTYLGGLGSKQATPRYGTI